MKRLRASSVLFLSWLLLHCGLVHLYEPMGFAPYAVAALYAAPLVIVPRLSRLSLTRVLPPLVVLVPLVQLAAGRPVAGAELPLTLTEIGLAAMTVALAHAFGRRLDDLEQSVVATLIDRRADDSQVYRTGMREMQREVRRARAFKRPLTMLAIAPRGESVRASLDRFTREAQQEAIQAYVQTRFAEVLLKATKGSDLITSLKDRFVMVLPETDARRAARVIAKVQDLARTELQLDVAIGSSTFPEEEVTFVKLMERAHARMKWDGNAALMSARRLRSAGPNGAVASGQPRETPEGSPSLEDRPREERAVAEFAPAANNGRG